MTEHSRWKGLTDLVCDAVDGTTRLAETTQNSVADLVVRHLSKVEALKEPAELVNEARRLGLGLTSGSIRAVNQGVRSTIGGGIEYASTTPDGSDAPASRNELAPMRSDQRKNPRFIADTLLGVINGVVGDHVRLQANDLDLGMGLRFQDEYFPPERAGEVLGSLATSKVALFVHGLAATETCWVMGAERAWGAPDQHFGVKLSQDLGYTPLFVRYNSGLHISENGRALAALLSQLHTHYPRPLEELAIIGHSLGGLVARSATHYASSPDGDPSPWLGALKQVITIGTPHFGSPLAQAGHALTATMGAIDTPTTQVIAAVGRRRSAAIKDLKDGYLVDEDWHGQAPDAWLSAPRSEVGFLDHVTYVFIGASLTSNPEHPVGRLVGDVLVRLSSSTHEHVDHEQSSFVIERQVLGGLHHLQIQNDPQVYEQIRLHLR